jgi:hypothetical protein
MRRLPEYARARALTFSLILALTLLVPPPARAAPIFPPSPPVPTTSPAAPATSPAISSGAGECGPPSTTIPGPPPELIAVGKPMSDSWLLCYIKQDFEGQTYTFDRWGETRKTSFRGYPVECWTQEADAGWQGRRTDGIVAEAYGWNLDHTQYVRFTYRIQLDGDYINNCHQEIVPTP